MPQRASRVSYRNGQRVIETTLRGAEVIHDPRLNKGMSFTAAERRQLGLEGLIPASENHTMEAQLDRAYCEYASYPTDLAKHLYMANLHDTNETVFFALMQRHLLEMLPVVYDPVVGEAIENFSRVWRRPPGAFLSIDHPDEVETRLANLGLGPDDVDLVVASDAEEILGIGDGAPTASTFRWAN